MNENELLKKIEKAAQKADLQGSIFSANEEFPYDCLTLFLGADDQGYTKTLEITAQQQIVDPAKESKLFRVQFSSKLPFEIADTCSNQTASLIALVNRFLDLPGFEMSELDDQVFYRYVLLVNEQGLTDELILSIIGSVMLMLDLYSRSFEAVASGKMSYNELLEHALKITAQKTTPA